MLDAVPRRAFFRFEIPIRYIAKTPLVTGDAGRWSRDYLLPALCEVDAQEPFADVYMAWNDDGLFVAFDVVDPPGPQCDPTAWWKQDGLRLCIDTRGSRDNKRATRFCRFFYFLPVGGGPSGRLPVVNVHRMSRAREPAPEIDLSLIKVAARLAPRHGYSLEAAIPAACLTGWDPAEHPRIGLFVKIKSVRLGSQNLTVTDDMGWNVDPSTWATALLVGPDNSEARHESSA